ncbi:hypothetical protein ACER0C_030182 [Sarotherodon galilaeus]
MNEVDYLDHNRAESLDFEEKPEIKPPDVEQLQDADINQTAVFPADVQQMLVIKEEELSWTPSLDQQNPDHLHIKEEHEELWIGTGGAYLADSTRRTLSSISMKCEDEREEKPQIVQLHQSQTEDDVEAEAPNSSSATKINNEIDEEDCGRPEIARNSKPNFHLQLNAVEKAPDSSETDISDGDDWQEPLSDPGPANEDGDSGCNIPKSNLKTLKSLKSKCSFQRRKTCHSFKRPHDCLSNEKFNRVKQSEPSKMKINTGEKTFTCGVCAKRFKQKQNLKTHMRVHTDVQQLLVIKEEVSHEWSNSPDQKGPEFLFIKEEQDELRNSEVGEPLNDLTKADIIRFQLTAGPVKTENDEEKPNSLLLLQNQMGEAEPPLCSLAKQIKTESDGEDCDGPEPGSWNPDPNTDEKASDSSATDVSDDDDDDDSDDGGGDWQEPLSDSGPPNDDSENNQGAPTSSANGLKSPKSKWPVQRLMTSHSMETSSRHLGNVDSPRQDRQFICGICGKRFTQKQNLKTHIRIHTGEKPFHCDFCGKRFRHLYSFKAHIRIHTGEKPFVCDICGERFTQQQNIKRHIRVHTGEKPFGCGVCTKRFTQQVDLKRHMRVHTREKPFGCDLCSKRYNRKTQLSAHMRVHTGEKQFACDICGKRFNRMALVKAHTRVHTGEKPYGCDVCGKRFNRKSHLKAHTRGHTGEKPHGCDVCGKNFVHQRDLKIHTRVHTGEKQFSCTVCGKRFTHQGTLTRHMRVHTGEKPFSCGVCGKTFTQKGNLNRHVKTHTE